MLLLEQFEHLTLHPKNAARLKELVLQLAVQGKLTENWRRQNPNVEPAAELLKRIEAEKAQLVKEKKIKKENPLKSILEDEVPYTLPNNWSWCRLNDIAEYIQRGKSPSYVDESDIPVVSQKCIQWDGFYLDRAKFIEPSTLSKYGEERLLIVNDILWNSTGDGTVGRATLYPGTTDYEKVVADSHVTVVRLMEKVKLPYFIKYFIASPTVQENLKVSGSTKQTELNTSTVKSQLVPLPPLAEQEAIVARVEELMQKIEELEKQTAERIKLKKNLSTAALQQLTTAPDKELQQNWLFLKQHFASMFDETENVKKLRETILQLAVQGKLTTNWRNQNSSTEPASELLKRIQAEKAQLVKDKKIKKEKPLEPISEDEVPYILPEGWVWCRLGSITNYGSSEKVEPRQADNNLWVLELEDVEKSTSKLLKKIKYSERYFQSTKSRFFKGDVIYGKLRPYLDKVIVADEDGVCTTEMIPFRGYGGINSYFLRLSLKDPSFIKYANDSTHGMNLPRMGTDKAREAILALPPLAEQEAIVAKVNQLMQLCDELEQHIQQLKQEAKVLMQAVVQEALQVQEEVEL